MFVQLNPDVNSFSETASTLKFAERVSGVELGAARSSKEGRDVKELMDQVLSYSFNLQFVEIFTSQDTNGDFMFFQDCIAKHYRNIQGLLK